MLRWLNAVSGQTITYANGSFGHGWRGLPHVNNGFDYAIGGYNNGSDYVTEPTSGDIDWDACRQNSLLNGTPLAIVQFITECEGVVGMVAGDSHQSGTGTVSSFNSFLAQLTTRLGRAYLDRMPFGFVNCAIGGIASQEIFSRLNELLPDVHPTFVVLPGWTYNEVHADVAANAAASSAFVKSLLQAANRCRLDGAEPVFLTPFPRDQASMSQHVLDCWRNMRATILGFRSNGAIVIDGGAMLGQVEGGLLTGTYRSEYSDDGMHPNDAGHLRVADDLARAVKSIIGYMKQSALSSRLLRPQPGTELK